MSLTEVHGANFLVVLLRVLPVVMLSPLLGGALVPGPIRLVISSLIAVWIQGACGLSFSLPPDGLFVLALEQLALGGMMGLAMTWSFDAAVSAGRWIDVLRGSSAEAFNPAVGSRDSAAGALLHRLLVASMCASGGMAALVSDLGRSFKWYLPGDIRLDAGLLERWVAGLAASFESGVVVAAPFAVLALSVDMGTAVLQRIAPSVPLHDAAVPARLLLGGALFAWDLSPAIARFVAGPRPFEVLLQGGSP